MTEQELLQLIEFVEQEELHPAPDYLKGMILHKAKTVPKRIQLIIYSFKTIAATAAALMILFTIPKTKPVTENTRQEERIKIQYEIQKEKQIQYEKMMKQKEKTSITDYLNQGTSYVCSQLLTVFEREPIN